jgi:carbonic anhydrase
MCEFHVEEVLENNKKWAQAIKEKDPQFFSDLSKGQHPKALLLGCSDSRVSPSRVLGSELGELFIHRNIANVVSHTDMNFLSVMQYAVEALGVEHIIVYGHYDCGGIRAALEDKAHGLIDNWLANIRDVIVRHEEELYLLSDADDKVNRLVELNVIAQLENIRQTSVYKKAMKNGKKIYLHPWVFNFRTGLVKVLNEQDYLRKKSFSTPEIAGC